MGLLWLLSLIAVGNFSTILLMRREGIKSLKSWKTAVICVLVVPIVTFVIVAAILHLMMIYD